MPFLQSAFQCVPSFEALLTTVTAPADSAETDARSVSQRFPSEKGSMRAAANSGHWSSHESEQKCSREQTPIPDQAFDFIRIVGFCLFTHLYFIPSFSRFLLSAFEFGDFQPSLLCPSSPGPINRS